MNVTEDMWLRGKAAQRSMMELLAFNAAFMGNASVQAFELMLSAPSQFWAAMGRVGGAGMASLAETMQAAADVAPAAEAKPAAKPKAVKTAKATPKAEPVAEPVAPTATAEVVPFHREAPAEPEVVEAAPATPGPSPHLLDAPRAGGADDLTVLKGVGPKLAEALNEFGIYHFDQIATLDADGIDWLNEQQNGFKMTCARYDLVEQAKAKLA